MKRALARVIGSFVYSLAMWVMTTRTDRWIASRLRRLAWLIERVQGPRADGPVALREAAQVFESGPEATALARRFILDARPEQFKAIVRGAILD